MQSHCPSSARPREAGASRLTRTARPQCSRSVAGSTGFRSHSSSPPSVSTGSASAPSALAFGSECRSWGRATVAICRASGRWRGRSTGATSSSRAMSDSCGRGSPSLLAGSRSTPQEVCGDAALDPESIPALLAELVEKSVLKRAQGGSRDRFRMLEILRQFGAERLRDAGAERELRVRHAEWIGRFASDVAVHRDRLVELFARARAEQTNIWTTLDFCFGYTV